MNLLAAGIGIGIVVSGIFFWFVLRQLEKGLLDDIKKRNHIWR